MALTGLAAVLSAAACAGPTDTAPPGTTPPPVPITARPLDLTRYVPAPCSMVPVALTERLGLTRREERHENVLIGAGTQAQCRISAAPPLTGVAELRLYPASRPLPLLTGVTPAPTPTSVGAYPAAQWILSTGRDGSATSCHSIVDVAPGQGFSVLVNGPAGEAIEKSCARARHLAESILAGLLT
ncbi:Uncharacterised protein [Amycolatopsis camponoti]|uniref:DUF3558 domain-containing protein n=2 Tax=Amycolatopsis camponoti TaxID=2606593 RepID=A0A6I8M1B2_9PSEU|nr:Uncharacterised protein [Amycolatopsis camponoti]